MLFLGFKKDMHIIGQPPSPKNFLIYANLGHHPSPVRSYALYGPPILKIFIEMIMTIVYIGGF